MKRIAIFAALFSLVLSVKAQTPQKFSYQGAARDAAGNVLASRSIGLRLSILHTSALGPVVYAETQLTTTNAQGLFSVAIGGGTKVLSPLSPDFNTIAWAVGSKFLKVEMVLLPTGTTTLPASPAWIDLGATELLSVPYALQAGSSENSWGLNGNSNASPLDFIGTRNGRSLNFKVNYEDAGTIGYSNQNTSFGYKSQASTATGTGNTAIGASSLKANLLGRNNTAVGSFALQSLNGDPFGTIGSNNTAIGNGSIAKATTGSGNTGVGDGALSSVTTGLYNTAVGSTSGLNFQTGRKNTFLGAFSNPESELNNATAIGAHAVVARSNAVVIGSIQGENGAGTTVNVGIGTKNPEERLHVVGNSRVDGEVKLGARGTMFTNMQESQVIIPRSVTASRDVTITFPSAFVTPSNVRLVVQTVSGLPTDPDDFVVTVKSVTATSAVIRIRRIDAALPWTREIRLNYMAWE